MRFFSTFFIVAAVIAAIWLQITEAVSPVPPPGWCPDGVGRGKILTS